MWQIVKNKSSNLVFVKKEKNSLEARLTFI